MTRDVSDETAGYWAPQSAAGAHEDPEHLRAHFDPVGPEPLTRGRYGRVAGWMARECPVTHTDAFPGGVWTVSGYDELLEVHRREGSELSNFPVLLQSFGNVRPVIPMESDPPLHRQYKQIISEPLSRAAQAAKEPYYREIVHGLLAPLLRRRARPRRAAPLRPVHRAVQPARRALADGRARRARPGPRPPRRARRDARPRARRRRRPPGRGDLHVLRWSGRREAAQARRRHRVPAVPAATVDGRPLTETEILDYCVILLPAGFETTASSMSMMFLLLAEEPELQAWLREDPERIPAALDELMRYVTPTRSHTRTVTADFEVGGHRIRTGERIYLNWAGRQRRPGPVFDRPDEIVPDRRPNRHMSYGFGSHLCVGVHMARAEITVAFTEVLAAMDDIRLVEPPDAVVEEVGTTWAVTHAARGIHAAPVRARARPARAGDHEHVIHLDGAPRCTTSPLISTTPRGTSEGHLRPF